MDSNHDSMKSESEKSRDGEKANDTKIDKNEMENDNFENDTAIKVEVNDTNDTPLVATTRNDAIGNQHESNANENNAEIIIEQNVSKPPSSPSASSSYSSSPSRSGSKSSSSLDILNNEELMHSNYKRTKLLSKSPRRYEQQHKPMTTTQQYNSSTSNTNKSNYYMSASTVKVIKGEIHNILSVMRADPRYASPLRFLEYSSNHNNTTGGKTTTSLIQRKPGEEGNNDVVHPLIWSLRDLSTKLSFAEQLSVDENYDASTVCDVVTYITPFCTAIISRDISANVTGAAISSLHKFLLYGFITKEIPRANEGIALIARSIRHCTFEEDPDSKDNRYRRSSNKKSSTNVVTSLMQSNSQSTKHKKLSKKGVSTVQIGTGGSGIFYNDEEVVLKLLSLSSLVIRCDAGVAWLAPKDIVGIFETCLHVACFATHASRLLQSAAGDALAHIILAVFGRTATNATNSTTVTSNIDKEQTPAIVTIMTKLVQLIDPTSDQEGNMDNTTCILSLSWINIALETGSTHLSKYPLILSILQNDLCKHLLRLSTTTDLVILQLTLRVIFNLFNSIKDHLKIQLEVFLQSVYFRLLSTTTTASNEVTLPQNKELVLESLLEFCHEPALMHDLYINYDCDMDCSNLFEKICIVLCEQAYDSGKSDDSSCDDDGTEDEGHGSGVYTFNVLNQLALEGLLVVIDSIARRCHTTTTLNELNRFYNQGSGTSCNDASSTDTDSSSITSFDESNYYDNSSIPLEDNEQQRYHPILLQERKRKKHALRIAASEFNNTSSDKEWISTLESLNVLPTPATSQSIAKFFYSNANHLDKAKVGLYLSKGPHDKYPFHLQVLKDYLDCFDFTSLKFDDALRSFLGRFRLPGEAQCIDRLMEAFAQKIYVFMSEEQGHEESSLFRNADAVYVLAFSTIMLNTDLHNPNMDDDRRMTCEQFINNNRGINDGVDLPREFLASLYQNIAQKEIQVEQDQLAQLNSDGNVVVDADGLFDSSNNLNNNISSFTPSKDLFHKCGVGVHERDMFNCMATSALTCLSNIFLQTHDDVVVVKALVGLQQMARISVYFGLDQVLNDILKQLLRYGKNYVTSYIFAKILLSKEEQSEGELDEEEYESFLDQQPVPSSLLFHKGNNLLGSSGTTHPNYYYHFSKDIVRGSATHRGLLSLHSALTLIKSFPNYVREAWPDFIQCLFVLRDANVLMPISLSDLDDFADSRGVVLPSSKFALASMKTFGEYFAPEEGDDGDGEEGDNGYFWSIFSNKHVPKSTVDVGTTDSTTVKKDAEIVNPIDDSPDALSPIKNALQKVSSSAQLETILIGATSTTAANRCKDQIIRSLLDFASMNQEENNDVSKTSKVIDPLFQHHAVFALELAARSLLTTNRQRIVELFPIFHSKVQYILKNKATMECLYLMERAVVTILRACIHLYDIAEAREQLELSLGLLIDLPSSFVKEIADRLGCGMAIILRSSFYHIPNSHKSWSLIYDLLRMTASCSQKGRGFVFDGIASTIEFACSSNENYKIPSEGCAALITLLCNFIAGTYDDVEATPFSASSPLCEHAMVCLERAFRHLCVEVPTSNHETLWRQIVLSLYNCCYSSAQQVSSPQVIVRQGYQVLHQFLFTTIPTNQISDDVWLDILKALSSSLKEVQPTSANIIFSNMKTLDLISRMLLLLLPYLSQRRQNIEILQNTIIQNIIFIIQNNIRQNNEMLREGTIHSVRNMSNVLLLSKESFSSDSDTNFIDIDAGKFCEMVATKLLAEIEKKDDGNSLAEKESVENKDENSYVPVPSRADNVEEVGNRKRST